MTNTSPGALAPLRPTEVKIGGAMRPISSTLSTVGDGTSPTPCLGSPHVCGLVHRRGGCGQLFGKFGGRQSGEGGQFGFSCHCEFTPAIGRPALDEIEVLSPRDQ